LKQGRKKTKSRMIQFPRRFFKRRERNSEEGRRDKFCFVSSVLQKMCPYWLWRDSRKKVAEYGAQVEFLSKELNHFGVIAGLFRQVGGHRCRFVLFCSFWRLFTVKMIKSVKVFPFSFLLHKNQTPGINMQNGRQVI